MLYLLSIRQDSKIIFNHSGKKPAKTIGAEKRASLRGKRRLSDTQAETSGSTYCIVYIPIAYFCFFFQGQRPKRDGQSEIGT